MCIENSSKQNNLPTPVGDESSQVKRPQRIEKFDSWSRWKSKTMILSKNLFPVSPPFPGKFPGHS